MCENRDGWLVAWGLCRCMLIRFSTVWLLPFTLLLLPCTRLVQATKRNLLCWTHMHAILAPLHSPARPKHLPYFVCAVGKFLRARITPAAGQLARTNAVQRVSTPVLHAGGGVLV